MGKKRILLSGLICGLLLLFTSFPAWAGNAGVVGGTTHELGGTEIHAGVVVDYMGKLRFVVLNRDTNEPIEGASIEIYIKSLNRYVLFGVTDSNGIYELDVAYNINNFVPDSEQYFWKDGGYVYDGSPLVYLSEDTIWYRAYKAEWLPYPYNGKYTVKGDEIPETIIIKLYPYKYEGKGSETTGGGGGSRGRGSIPGVPPLDVPDMTPPLVGPDEGGIETGGIPKTGVEGTFHYWALGLIFFLLAGGAIRKLSKMDRES